MKLKFFETCKFRKHNHCHHPEQFSCWCEPHVYETRPSYCPFPEDETERIDEYFSHQNEATKNETD